MKFVFKFLLVGLVAGALLGCQDQVDPDYLMRHPKELKHEADRCELLFVQSPRKQSEYCKKIMGTFSKFMAIVTEQEIAPEEFGKRVLREEMKLAKLKKQLAEHQYEVDMLKSSKAPSSKIINAVTRLTQLEQSYKQQSQKVSVLLAVIGISTPG